MRLSTSVFKVKEELLISLLTSAQRKRNGNFNIYSFIKLGNCICFGRCVCWNKKLKRKKSHHTFRLWADPVLYIVTCMPSMSFTSLLVPPIAAVAQVALYANHNVLSILFPASPHRESSPRGRVSQGWQGRCTFTTALPPCCSRSDKETAPCCLWFMGVLSSI